MLCQVCWSLSIDRVTVCARMTRTTCDTSAADPTSPVYGHHLSQDEVRLLTAASEDVVAQLRTTVQSLCPACHVTVSHAHGDEAIVTGPAPSVAHVVGTPRLRVYTCDGQSHVASPVLPTLPPALQDIVLSVSGVQLPGPATTSRSDAGGTSANAAEDVSDVLGRPGSGSQPWPMTGMAADTQLYVILLPFCQNGTMAHNASNLCGGALARFEVLVNSSSFSITTPVPLSDAQCTPAVYFPGVFCTVNVNHSMVDDVMNYVYARSVFQDGSVSDWSYYQGLTPTVWASPASLYELYRVPAGMSATNNVTQAMVQFSGASFRQSDLDLFCTKFQVPQPKVSVHGINNPNMINFEPQLDMQMLAGIGRGAHLVAWITQPAASVEGLTTWASEVNNASKVPSVFSISYGSPAVVTTAAQRAALDYQLMKLGLRGITVMAATGDSGLQGGVNVSCTKFTTTVLATSPYITAVGGAAVWMNNTQIAVQSDVGMYYTVRSRLVGTASTPCHVAEPCATLQAAGGFSNYRPRPSFQADAVEAYLKTNKQLPPASTYSPGMRAIPDVSAIAINAWTVNGGELQPTGGTSTASPCFAGIVTLLVNARVSKGLSTLGWINPLL